jgi:hypothetical protein
MHHESEWGPRPERECGDEVHILGKKIEPVWPFLDGLPLGEDDVADVIVCGPDPAKHIEKIQAFAKAGYDHVYTHQVGPDQEGFSNFMNRKFCQSLGRHYM